VALRPRKGQAAKLISIDMVSPDAERAVTVVHDDAVTAALSEKANAAGDLNNRA
jgi:hypothetical protein